MGRPTRALIDRQALKANLETLKSYNGTAFFCPMVKANAYGHGLDIVAPIVQEVGADMAGVALVEEGVRLRQLGFKSPILVFAPLQSGDRTAVEELNLTPVVGRFEDLELLAGGSRSTRIPVHLKFNTGMNRLGFDNEDVPTLQQELARRSYVQVVGACTHLSHGSDALQTDGPTAKQISRFIEMSKPWNCLKHVHKSATLMTCELNKIHSTFGARPGISMYGLPYDHHRLGRGLRPALQWISELIRLHEVPAGESASYASQWIAKRRSLVGVVPVGYGDGYPRTLSNRSFMGFRGHKVPVIGRVCMDYVMLDLTDAVGEGGAKPGEAVEILGPLISATDLADWAETIEYEIVTAISARVPREAI
ncbi:MAG: alanine racemase [Bdellovibrionales bacterium]